MIHFARFLVVACLLAGLNGCERPASSSTAQSQTAAALPSDDELRERIDQAVDFASHRRHMDQQKNAAWQVVHGILAYGRDLQMYVDGQLVSALDYLLQGGTLNGWNLRKGDHGVTSLLEPGSKTGMGHPDQWLGYMSQCGISLDEPLVVGGGKYKIGDLLTQAQWDIFPGMEATWTLMAASTYLPLDAEWTSRDGSKWTIDRIVDMEADQGVEGAPCGGTHRLYGLTAALNRHLDHDGKLEGAWLKADRTIKEAIDKAKANQQPDGTFSTNYFARPGTSSDLALRLSTSGHTFEFLTLALDDEQFNQPWMTRALVSLLDMLERTQEFDLECGGLYHAIHGLELYRIRRFGAPTKAAVNQQDKPLEGNSTPAQPAKKS